MQAAIVHENPASDTPVATGPAPQAVGFSAVFRREDDEICHARCGSPLGFRGVRGRHEADFYCLKCTATVTVPVVVLETLLGAPAAAPLRVVAGRGRREKSARAEVTQAA